MIQRILAAAVVSIASLSAVAGIVGCDDRTPAERNMDKAGDKIENAADKVGDATKDAADNVGDKAEKAGDKIKDATN